MLTELEVDTGEAETLMQLAGEQFHRHVQQMSHEVARWRSRRVAAHRWTPCLLSGDQEHIDCMCADADGDGFVSFDEFKTLMNSKAVAKPNALNRYVSIAMCSTCWLIISAVLHEGHHEGHHQGCSAKKFSAGC